MIHNRNRFKGTSLFEVEYLRNSTR